MTIRPFDLTTPTGQIVPSWGVYDNNGRLLAPCGTREIAQKWRRLHDGNAVDDGCAAGDRNMGPVDGREEKVRSDGNA